MDEMAGATGFAKPQESNVAPSTSKSPDSNPSNPSSAAKARARHSSRAIQGDKLTKGRENSEDSVLYDCCKNCP